MNWKEILSVDQKQFVIAKLLFAFQNSITLKSSIR